MLGGEIIKKVQAKLSLDENFKAIVLSSFSTLFAKISGSLFGLLSGIIIARNYGAEIIGTVSVLSSSMALIALFASFGLHVVLLKKIPACRNTGYDNYFAMIRISFFFTLVLSLILWGAIHFFYPEKFNEYIPLAIIVFVYLKIGLATLRGFNDVKAYSFFTSAPSLVRFLLLFLVTFHFYHKDFPILLVFVIPLITDVCLLIYIHIKYSNRSSVVAVKSMRGKKFYRQTLALGFPFMLTEGMYLLISNVDIVMLGAMKGKSLAGIYSICTVLIALLSMVYISIQSFATSKFSLLHSENKEEELKSLAIKISKLNFILHLFPSLVLIFFGEIILGELYGKEFVEGYSALVILVVAILTRSCCGLSGTLLNMAGHQKVFSLITLFVVILNVVLNWVLIPLMGIDGAAISTAVSLIIWGVLPALVVYFKLGFNMVYIPFMKTR